MIFIFYFIIIWIRLFCFNHNNKIIFKFINDKTCKSIISFIYLFTLQIFSHNKIDILKYVFDYFVFVIIFLCNLNTIIFKYNINSNYFFIYNYIHINILRYFNTMIDLLYGSQKNTRFFLKIFIFLKR